MKSDLQFACSLRMVVGPADVSGRSDSNKSRFRNVTSCLTTGHREIGPNRERGLLESLLFCGGCCSVTNDTVRAKPVQMSMVRLDGLQLKNEASHTRLLHSSRQKSGLVKDRSQFGWTVLSAKEPLSRRK